MCGAFHIRTARPLLLQHHAARPRGHRHAAGARDARGRRRHLGRRLDLQGQRHRALLPLRPAGQPAPAHLQAVARRRSSSASSAAAQRDVGVAGRARPALPRQRRRRPTPPTPTSGAPPTRPRRWSTSTTRSRSSSRSWACSFWDPSVGSTPRTSSSRFERGPARRDQRRAFASPSTSSTKANEIGGRHGLGHERPDREPHHRGQEPRHLRGAGHGAAVHRPTNGCSTPIHNEDTIANYHTEGRRLGRLLYEGRWLDPQSLMLRESLNRWVAGAVTGEVVLRLRRGEDYTIVATIGPEPVLPPGPPVAWSASRTPPSARSTASAS